VDGPAGVGLVVIRLVPGAAPGPVGRGSMLQGELVEGWGCVLVLRVPSADPDRPFGVRSVPVGFDESGHFGRPETTRNGPLLVRYQEVRPPQEEL